MVRALVRNAAAQFLQWALDPDTEFGDSTAIARKDGWYIWRVSDVHRETGGRTRYRLTYPDTEAFEVVPGIGLTRFHYHHHGTPMSVDGQLVGRCQR